MNNVFENRGLRRMFEHWGEEILGCCRKFLSEELLIFVAHQVLLI
jgi:hypothetical protein